MEKETSPKLFIIAGCNGAGKTTAAMTLLPEMLGCHQFVNADEIAHGLSPFGPASVAFTAGRIMLARVAILMAARATFAIETTLATRSYAQLIKAAHKAGYTVELLFVWLASPQAAKVRVARRVAEGGHDIPDHIIERRYAAGLANLFDVFMPIVDFWTIVDNSQGLYEIVASTLKIENETTYSQIKATYDRNRDGKTALAAEDRP